MPLLLVTIVRKMFGAVLTGHARRALRGVPTHTQAALAAAGKITYASCAGGWSGSARDTPVSMRPAHGVHVHASRARQEVVCPHARTRAWGLAS